MIIVIWNKSLFLTDLKKNRVGDIKCVCDFCDLRDLFFGHVDGETMNRICEERQEKSYQKGDFVVREGNPIKEFMYLKEGLVKLYRVSESGKSQILAIGKPLDFVSLISVFSSPTYNYSVEALVDSTTCNLDINFIKRMASENGSFAIDLMQKMSKASDTIILNNLKIRERHLSGRIALLLMQFSREIYKSDQFEIPVSRKEIAEYIGMTTENVIRTLSEFRKDGLLKIFGKHIEIVDHERLQRIAEHG